MAETLKDVQVFGFEDAELARWPEDYGLRPNNLTLEEMLHLPDDEPLIIHVRLGVEATRTLETAGSENDVILYVPQGQDVPRGAYYEARITDAGLPALRGMLAHPEQFRMRELAEDVPLGLLARAIETIDLGELGLPEQASRHLSGCRICQRALREALQDKVLLYQKMFCPSPGMLIVYSLEGSDGEGSLRTHIDSCPLCGPQLSALRDAFTGPKQRIG
ncbi:MAG TPA: hypothetical protein VGE45_01880 [Chloroflexia bacterium]|jgi:hypothetical protein